jgi:GxxExxY protein
VDLNECTGIIVDSAVKVHWILGPGLLESSYHACLLHELRKRGLDVESQLPLPIHYDGLEIDAGYRIDMLVNGEVVVELKSVPQILPIHEAQLLSYMRLSRRRVGLLINFNVVKLKDGIRRKVNGL